MGYETKCEDQVYRYLQTLPKDLNVKRPSNLLDFYIFRKCPQANLSLNYNLALDIHYIFNEDFDTLFFRNYRHFKINKWFNQIPAFNFITF